MCLKYSFAQALFALTTFTSCFAEPAKPCKVLLSDDHEISVVLPDGTPASTVPISWTANGMPLDDQTSQIRFNFAPWDRSSYEVVATSNSGSELCRATVTLPPAAVAVVPYVELYPWLIPPVGSSASEAARRQAQMQMQAMQQSYSSAASAARSQSAASAGNYARSSQMNRASAPPPTRSVRIKVYYATERQPLSALPPAFSNQLSPGNQLTYGFAAVTVPTTHKRHFIGDPTYWSYSANDFTAGFSPAVTQEAFYYGLQQEMVLNGPTCRQLLVFIHGFNNGFEEDIYKTAELVYDTRFNGVPVMFDWPSKDGPLDYTADRTASNASVVALAEFLRTLGQRSGQPVINIVAHSMGNRLLLEALDRLQQKNQLPQLGQVVLAAPDIDQARFQQIMPDLIAAHSIQRVTMYGSSKDMAMWLSKRANGAEPVGHMPPVPAVSGVDAVDVSRVPMNVLGHDYFITTRPVLDDMGLLFQSPDNAPPRHGLVQVMQGSFPYWQFPAGSN